MRIMATLLAALVVAAPATASTGSTRTFRYDDGTAESSVHVDSTFDHVYRFFDLPSGITAVTTAAEVWVYGRAAGCDAAPEAKHRIAVNTVRLAAFDPCAVLPADGFGWARMDLPVSALRDGPGNYVYFGITGEPLARTAHYGIDTSTSGHSQVNENGGSPAAGELMAFVVLSGRRPAAGLRPVAFGLVSPGTTATRVATVENTGYDTLRVDAASIAGDAAFSVTADGCAGAALAPGAACAVTLAYSPAAVGDDTATLTVSGNATAVTTLTGTGASAPPVSSFAVADGAVHRRLDALRGAVTDDLGVAAEHVRFAPVDHSLVTVSMAAALSCDAARTACAWSVPTTYLLPGRYDVTAHGTDVQGVAEFPGQTIRIVVV